MLMKGLSFVDKCAKIVRENLVHKLSALATALARSQIFYRNSLILFEFSSYPQPHWSSIKWGYVYAI